MSSRLVLRVGPVLAVALALIGEETFAQTTTRVNVDSAGQQATSGVGLTSGLSFTICP